MVTWGRYSSALERFTAEFPGTVERRFFGFLADDGLSPSTVVYTCRPSPWAMYQVSVTRLLTYFGSPQDLLEAALEDFACSITGGTLVNSHADAFKGFPALRFLLKIGDTFDLMGTALLKDRTLYFLTLMHARGTEQEFERFCELFQIEP